MSAIFANPLELILGVLLILSAVMVLFVRRPVHASLAFLSTLIFLAAIYLRLSASFIAVMQILVYAGAILVIFIFVMVLFQDAHAQIDRFPPNSSKIILSVSVATFILSVILLGLKLFHYTSTNTANPPNFGSVESLGMALYIDYFFPFEAIILLFLVAIIGAFFIARREEKNEY